MNQIATVAEAAAEKGVSESGIRQAIREGRLRADERGRVYLIHRRDLDRWQKVGHRPRAEQRQKRAAARASIETDTREE